MKALQDTTPSGPLKALAAPAKRVRVRLAAADEPVRLASAEERELAEAMEEIRRGNYVDGEVLLSELRSLLA
jgi:hypothetical protein